MEPIQLKEMANIVNGTLQPPEAGNMHVLGISTDTRTLQAGDLFFAIVGEKYDGHNFIQQAIDKHAIGACISTSSNVSDKIPVIKVTDTLAALGIFAKYYKAQFNIPTIAISGAVGKTTTRAMVAAVLSKKYRVVESIKNFNNLIGLPLSIFQLADYHEYAIFELGINQLGEMSKLLDISKPDHAILTNIIPVHLEGLGSFENLKKEKLRLLEAVPMNGKIFLNTDDYTFATTRFRTNGNIVWYGSSTNSNYRIEGIKLGEAGTPEFSINGENIKLSVLGRHNVYNAAAAFAVGDTFGVKTSNTINALSEFKGLYMRMNLLNLNRLQIINDSYNANPASVRSAIDTLREMPAERRIALLGDMLELGDKSADFHREIGILIKEAGVDILITFGEEARQISEAAITAGMPEENVFHSEARGEIKLHLKEVLTNGDLILVKGSRGMAMEKFTEYIMENTHE